MNRLVFRPVGSITVLSWQLRFGRIASCTVRGRRFISRSETRPGGGAEFDDHELNERGNRPEVRLPLPPPSILFYRLALLISVFDPASFRTIRKVSR